MLTTNRVVREARWPLVVPHTSIYESYVVCVTRRSSPNFTHFNQPKVQSVVITVSTHNTRTQAFPEQPEPTRIHPNPLKPEPTRTSTHPCPRQPKPPNNHQPY